MQISLFVASPGDVLERHGPVDHVVSQLNATTCRDLGVVIDVKRWESDAPRGPAERLQGAINPMLDDAEIVLIIFWRRFGTPSGVAPSGTAEEYMRAMSGWRARGHPRALLYFCETPAAPPRHLSEAEHILEVTRFRNAAEKDGLVGLYRTETEFSERLLRDLYEAVHAVVRLRQLPIERSLAASLDRERINCQQSDRPFHTPSLLVALLNRPEGHMRLALETLEPVLPDALLEWLREAEARLSAAPEHRFSEFAWMERPDVRDALARAQAVGRADVSEADLFAACIARGGSTIKALEAKLGAERFTSLTDMMARGDLPQGYDALLKPGGF